MAITDGMRTHDEGMVKRYRMPDLLTLEEMKIYFAGTYGVGIELVDLSDELREKASGVGTLPYSYEPSPRDSDKVLLRKELGLDSEDDLRELHSRVMTRSEFEEKYGPQPAIETPEQKEARLNPSEGEETNNVEQVEEDTPVSSTPSSNLDDLIKRQQESST